MVFDETLTNIAEALLRFSSFAAHAILFGLIPISLLVLRPTFAAVEESVWGSGRARVAGRIGALVNAMLVAAGAAAVLSLTVKAILIANVQRSDLTAESFRAVADSSFGQWYLVRLPVLVVLAIVLVGRVRTVLLSPRGPSRSWWLAWGALALLLLATTTFAGHSSVAQPRGVALVNDIVHLAAGSTWFTGIVILAIVLPDAWIAKQPVERLEVLAPTVLRFSKVALVSISIVGVTGGINSLLHVGELNDMTSTSYGEALTIKLILFAVVLAMGGINHYILRARLERALGSKEPTSAQKIFRRTIAIELAMALGLMGITGVLVGLPRTKGAPSAMSVTRVEKLGGPSLRSVPAQR
jgi:putative copper export protein